MGVYGALFSAVSGLKAQGQNMGIISDNIANANTVGYKASVNKFETLAPGYQLNSIYSGDPDHIPSQDRYVLGFGASFGIDPSLFIVMLKSIATGP